jgi:hypothetical protein
MSNEERQEAYTQIVQELLDLSARWDRSRQDLAEVSGSLGILTSIKHVLTVYY